MNQFGLQFLKPRLCLLLLGQVPDEPGEVWLAARLHFADRKMHWKGRSVFSLTGYNSPDANNMPFSR